MALLTRILGDPNEKEVQKLTVITHKINALEPEYLKLDDKALKAKTEEFKQRISTGESLDDIMPEAFATVREASRRVLGLRHYDVQLIGGMVLHEGKIAEMKTGEGKTLVATLAAYLNALTGDGIHVVTVNDYLAKRDTGWNGKLYSFLGLSVGCIIHEESLLFDEKYEDPNVLDERTKNLRPVSRKNAYAADITYGTNNEFGFDYLRDNMVQNAEQMVQRKHNFVIVDEVDSILIDEARTPLIISAPAEEATDKYYEYAKMVEKLTEGPDYALDEKLKAVSLSEEGIEKLEKMLGVDNIYESHGIEMVHHVEQSLKAKAIFKKDRDYVVKDGEIVIVDEFTGRLMLGRRYSGGLHQAIEAKEGVAIKQESLTLATISFQNYFRLYNKLSGMTGTAATEAEEFAKIYELEVTIIPTNREMVRKDLQDKVFKNKAAKFDAVVRDIKERYEKGQPVLVGTISIEYNELLSHLLKKAGIKHEVLNAKNHEKEALIISEAGKKGAVTVATNMAGRGTDIVLEEGVNELGGLAVIGTERHESRRIDNQLRGRAGRQGDAGSSQFYVSLEDDLMRIFGSDRVIRIMDGLGVPEDQPIENKMISKALESAQKKVEGHNFDIRKHLVEYDDVMNKHREFIYSKRSEVLVSESLRNEIVGMIQSEIEKIVDVRSNIGEGDVSEQIFEAVNNISPISPSIKEKLSKAMPHEAKEILKEYALEAYATKENETTPDLMHVLEKAVYLRVIDSLWIEHLEAMDRLRDGIGLRGYGQKDPLVEYKNEAYNMFQTLTAGIESEIVYTIYKVTIARNEPREQETELTKAAKKSSEGRPADEVRKPAKKKSGTGEKVGRNDACPCGSGKKYKKCCGK
ncbi:TPA: preprotein translocase subunit SecA [candidate division CPR2 bacterium]|uniref:Protein translocase subunit SecA n=1 Tax=candidate division CPR2 bacterium GW2011_GWC1_41_48 TaxID=1618344 RepID=A0A0G0WCD9_UNCC2|nr:MAG: Protein translocase subunit SecA [candidate division CPR2 bacterium GW2011_GWC2_39_35]KKR28574.1 MAG: Protein translocase subunit SecA [candidate division CPR2 bacterium GW2011_GWD2_39_7]KKS09712.1 MAG: protein translocase subunit SecA, preprotein translocase subunit SecA [candidate division CPR2 bacterium GW2011_GWC1_41_48]OGB72831.1 MAG: preprotein translocase subunit SecA [candidate division CPR2 bacterium GWD2_39_7]HBG81509.1 preprotein translocase subunit SecA [candidate division C